MTKDEINNLFETARKALVAALEAMQNMDPDFITNDQKRNINYLITINAPSGFEGDPDEFAKEICAGIKKHKKLTRRERIINFIKSLNKKKH